jgi:hypothetical protein
MRKSTRKDGFAMSVAEGTGNLDEIPDQTTLDMADWSAKIARGDP